nr:tetratricopeptide repeat protein [Cytophagales bacterium]
MHRLNVVFLLLFALVSCSPSPDELLTEGINHLKSGEYTKAIEYFDRVIEKDSANFAAWNVKGVAYFEMKEFDQSLAAFQRAVALDSTSYKAYFNRGNAYLEKKEYKNAIVDYNFASGLDPNQPDIYYNRGLALLGLESYEDALVDFDLALRANPNQPQVHFNKAKALLGNNDPLAAISSLTDVINLDKRNGAAYYMLGITQMSALGNTEEGCAHLKMALSLGYTVAKEWTDEFCQ